MNDRPAQPEPLAVPQIEAARLLSVSEQTIRNWRRKGKLKGDRRGDGKVMFSLEQLRKVGK
jgi:DNA-binding transcriptional MerR regulator